MIESIKGIRALVPPGLHFGDRGQVAGIKTLCLDHPHIGRGSARGIGVVDQRQVSLGSGRRGEGKAHGAERDGGAVFSLSIQISQAYITAAASVEIIFPQVEPLVAERVLAEDAGGYTIGMMDGIAGVSGIVIDRPPFTGAPGDRDRDRRYKPPPGSIRLVG